jgi:shikimate kinase
MRTNALTPAGPPQKPSMADVGLTGPETVARPEQARPGTGIDVIRDRLGDRLIVLVGLMASGKTSVGRILAQRLGLGFIDADHEIETAARMTIPEFFASQGEAAFRSGEKRVIARLLRDGPRVLATGGGAYMDADTRLGIRERGVSVWLKADLDTLMRRARRRTNRPLLQTADPEATMRELMQKRYPVYAEADVCVQSIDGPHDATANAVLEALAVHFSGARQADEAPS